MYAALHYLSLLLALLSHESIIFSFDYNFPGDGPNILLFASDSISRAYIPSSLSLSLSLQGGIFTQKSYKRVLQLEAIRWTKSKLDGWNVNSNDLLSFSNTHQAKGVKTQKWCFFQTPKMNKIYRLLRDFKSSEFWKPFLSFAWLNVGSSWKKLTSALAKKECCSYFSSIS